MERLLQKAEIDNQSECLNWQGSIRDGYGMFWAMGKLMSAHRMIWELNYGDIPDGLQVLHHCDNRRCINIHHLFLGTQSDNLKDAISKGRLNLVECGRKRSVGAKRDSIGKYI